MKVTVLIPAYNAEKHLAEAIESVLNQTYRDFDLIVINDGSVDRTQQILESYQDARLKILTQENRGIAESLNRGLRETTNSWIIIMHADDVMLPNRLERQIDFIENNPEIRVTCCRATYIGEGGKIHGKTSVDLLTPDKFQWYLDNNEAIGLIHPAVAFHRETILSVGGYRQPFWPSEDIDLWNRVAERGHLILAQDEVLMHYRIHNGSISTSKFNMTRLRYEWTRASMWARRKNQPEPSWEEFQIQWNNIPLLSRLDRDRKSNAKAYYHAAGHDCLRGNYAGGLIKLAWAAILQPTYVLPRLKVQMGR